MSPDHPTTPPLSNRSLQAAAAVGLIPDDPASASRRALTRARHAADTLETALDRAWSPHAPNAPAIVLLTGPSGAGKSLALHEISRRLGPAAITATTPPSNHRSPIDLLKPLPVTTAISLLAHAGLADARAFLTPSRALSQGQRARLSVAIAFKLALQARRRLFPLRPLVIIDELGSLLDRPAAYSLARTIRRFLSTTHGIDLLAASVDDHLVSALQPNQHITLDADGVPNFITTNNAPASSTSSDEAHTSSLPNLDIRTGSLADYRALAHHHYRAGAPRAVVRVLTARDAASPSPIGVLVVSMPPLNMPGRDRAFIDHFPHSDRRARAARINTDLRTISRVVVHPRYRGMSIASSLVRAYLNNPLTTCTEALASMATWCPLFEHAGMTPHDPPPSRRDRRLLDSLDDLGIPPWRLADPAFAHSPRAADPKLLHALRRWADDSRATRRLVHSSPRELLAAAARSIAARKRYFTHTTAASASSHAAARSGLASHEPMPFSPPNLPALTSAA